MKKNKSFSLPVRPRINSFKVPSENPLLYEIEWTLGRKIQCVFMAVVAVPIKLFLFCVATFFSWLFACLILILNEKFPQKQLNSFRIILSRLFRVAARLIYFALGLYQIKIIGERATASEAPILIAAPHFGFWDFVIHHVSDPFLQGVSREGNSTVPILGTIYKATEMIFVSRTDRESRLKTIQEIKRRVIGPTNNRRQIAIFPEGTCQNGKALITFKQGAFIPGVAVQPVLIEYLNDWKTFSWTAMCRSPYKTFFCSLCQFSIKMRLTYLPVYHPSAAEKADSRLYANNVRALMADKLNIACTEHSYEDCQLMLKARSLNLPKQTGIVEFNKINQKLDLSIDILLEKLEEFSKISRNGLLSLEDFSQYLKVPITPVLRKLFDLYDRDDSGFIDFREYIIGQLLVSQSAATKESVKLLVKTLKKNNKWCITENKLNQVVNEVFGDNVDERMIFQEIENSLFVDGRTSTAISENVYEKPEYAQLMLLSKKMLTENSQ